MDKSQKMNKNGVRNSKGDRRSLRTRQSLSEAFMALMMEKSYDAITVEDIIDRANVGRSTFYTHFEHKDGLLSSNFSRLMEELNVNMVSEQSGAFLPSLALFRHVQNHYALYKALVWGRGLEYVSRSIQGVLSKSIESQINQLLAGQQRLSMPPDLIANYVSSAFLTLLKWWLDNDLQDSPERMDERFHQLVLPGVRDILDSDPTR